MIGQGSLQLQNLREGDTGTYTCRAENVEDSVDSGANLELQGNFTIHIIIMSYSVQLCMISLCGNDLCN